MPNAWGREPIPQDADPSSRFVQIVHELDAWNAPDEAYRQAFSSFSKVALKRGETWRGRLIDFIRRYDCSSRLSPMCVPRRSGWNTDDR